MQSAFLRQTRPLMFCLQKSRSTTRKVVILIALLFAPLLLLNRLPRHSFGSSFISKEESIEDTNDDTDPDITVSPCPIHLIAIGNHIDYNVSSISHWLKQSRNDCVIQIMRDNNPSLIQLLRPQEKRLFRHMIKRPVVLADFMKLLNLFYFGGVVADFDVVPLKPFPDAWMNTPSLNHCDAYFGLEHDCFEGDCVPSMSRSGQIQTWTTFVRRPRLAFIRYLIDAVVENIGQRDIKKDFDDIQDISGSGVITDTIRSYLGRDYVDMPLVMNGVVGSLRFNRTGILSFPYQLDEQICILGLHYTRCSDEPTCLLKHMFDSTWRHQ